MTLEKAIERLKAEYEMAENNEWIQNPLAYALYKVWKIADTQKGRE